VIVDAHIHFWRLARGDNVAVERFLQPLARDIEMADLAPQLDAAGVARIVLVQAAESLAETLYTTGMALAEPRIAGVVGWCDPGSPSLEEEVRALRATGRLKGFRPVRDDNLTIAWLLDRRLAPGLDLLARHGLVLDILLQNPDELPLVTYLAARHPELAMVLDHAGKPDIAGGRLDPWRDDIGALAALPNVACKVSGLLNCAVAGAGAEALRPYADHLLDRFGPDRLIWASDWPPLSLAAPYERWLAVSRELLAGLDEPARAGVMGRNAVRVYGLDD
jgi:L-fuconolactonase